MGLNYFLSVILARRVLVLAALAASLLAAIAISLAISPRYQASTTVVVDLFAFDRIGGAQMSPMAMNQYMATQLGILKSNRVALDVVKRLALAEDPKMRADFNRATAGEGRFDDWAAERLLRNLDVRPARESGVVELVATARDAKIAAATADAFAAAYIDTVLALRTDPARETTAFFNETSRGLNQELASAQSRLSQFQDSRGLVAAEERLDSENARLEQLSIQLSQAQAQSADARTRQTLARQASARNGDVGSLPDILASGMIQSVKTDLAREENRLKALAERLGPNHPEYQSANEELGLVKKRLAAEIARVVGAIDNTARLAADREAELRAAVNAQRERVQQLRRARGDAQLLARDVERSQRSLDIVRERQSATNLESQARQTNIAVLNPAVVPIDPSYPKLGLNVAIATLLGLLLGVSLAVTAEFADRRIYRREELQAALALPVLAEITSASRHPVGLPVPGQRLPGPPGYPV